MVKFDKVKLKILLVFVVVMYIDPLKLYKGSAEAAGVKPGDSVYDICFIYLITKYLTFRFKY